MLLAACSKWKSSLFDQFYTDKKTDGLKLSRLFGGLTLQR